MTIHKLTQEVLTISEEAGKILLSFFRKEHEFTIKDKEAVSNDFATGADFASQAYIISKLKELRPYDIFVAEEDDVYIDSKSKQEGTLIWHVDPLDGTVNFSRGSELFAVSIGAVDAVTGQTVLGVIHAPAMNRTYFSYDGKAYLKDGLNEAVEFKTLTHPTAHLLSIGFAYEATERTLLVNELPELMNHFGDIRHTGSSAMNLCFLAEGRVDAHIDMSIKTYDFMAGKLIAQSAGVIVETTVNPRTGHYSLCVGKTEEDFLLIQACLAKINS